MIWAGLATQAQPTSWVRTFARPDDDRADNMVYANGRFYVVGTYGLALAYIELDMQGNVLHNLEIRDFMPYSFVPTHIIPYRDSVRVWGSGALCLKPMYITLDSDKKPISNYMYMFPTGNCTATSAMYIHNNKHLLLTGVHSVFNDSKLLFQRFNYKTSELVVSKGITGTDNILKEQGGPIKIFPTGFNGNYYLFTQRNIIEVDSMGNAIRIQTLRDRHPNPSPFYENTPPPHILDIVQGDSNKYVSIDDGGYLNMHDSTGRIVSSMIIPKQQDGSFSVVNKMCRTQAGGYAFAGQKFLKLDRNFNVISSGNLLYANIPLAAFNQAPDGGFYGCYHDWVNNTDPPDITAFKTEPDGRILTGVGDVHQKQLQRISYPNPVKDILYLHPMQDVQQISLTNTLGQTVYTGLETAIDMHSLPIGMYYLHVTTSTQQYVEPIIKQ
jgi:hypothetical protein